MAAGNGLNMAVGLDLSQLQKDLNKLHKDLQAATSQQQVIQIKSDFKKYRSDIRKEMKHLRTEMDSIGTIQPNDLKARAAYLRRLITLQSLYNQTYLHATASGKRQLAGYQSALNIVNTVREENRLLGQQQSMLGRLKNLASNYLSVFTIANVGKKITDITGYFDQQRVALEGIVGSAEKANELLNKIKSFALQSPKTTKELVGYTKQLSAYSIPYEELFDTTKRLADLSTGLGVDMQRLILAYGQVKAAAVLRGQELRQFTEAGIPMVQALADKFTKLNGTLVTTGEVFEMISKRQVSFEVVKSVLEDMTNEGGKFYKMQENIVETLYGQVQKLGDVWTLTLDKVGNSGGGILMKTIKLLQVLAENAQSLISGLLVGVIIKSLSKAPGVLVAMNASFRKSRIEVTALSAKIKQLKNDIQWASANSALFAKELKLANSQLRAFQLQKIAATASMIGGAIALVAGSAITIVEALTRSRREFDQTLDDIDRSSSKEAKKLTDGLDSLITKLEAAKVGTKEYNKALETLKSNYGEYVNESLIDSLVQERKALNETAASWGQVHDMIVAAINAKKEWDRHISRSEAAGNSAVDYYNKKAFGFGATEIERLLGKAIGRNGGYGNVGIFPNDIGKDTPTVNALKYAINDFFSSNLKIRTDKDGNRFISPEEDFKEILAKNAKTYAPQFRDALNSLASDLFSEISQSRYYKQFLEEQSILAQNPRRKAEDRFDEAVRRANESNEGKWIGDAKSKKVLSNEATSFNPYLWGQNAQEEYTRAIRDNVSDFDKELSDVYKQASDKDKKTLLKSKEEYESALDEVNKAYATIDGASVKQPKEIADALTKLMNAIKSPEYRERLSEMRDRYIKLAGTISGVSERVAQNIQNISGVGSKMTVAQKEFFARWLPTEQTLESNRDALRSLYQSNKSDIDSHRGDSVWKELIEQKEEENRWIKILAGKEYYDIVDLEKSSGGGGNNREFPEWVNIFKDAYDLYKRATTEGGTQRGVAKVLTDKTVQELYGDFFKNPGAIKEFGFKVGNKTVGEIIQENLIEGGLEDGIVDFQKAATATAKEMIAYGKASEETRGHFIKAGEQLLKWVSDTFADDSIKTWIDELSRSLENLTVDFQSRKSDIELYRQLINNGTASQLGIKVPGVTDERDVIRPESSNIRSYIMQIIGEYNSSLRSLSNESGIEYSPYQIGDIGSLDGISRAMKELTDPENMNNNAFTATEDGKVVMDRLIKALGELDKTMRDEMKKLSGMSATGNTLNDALINAGIKAGSSQINNEAVQAIAKALGISPDQVAAAARVESAKGSVDNVFKSFQTSMPFDALFHASRKPIDISTFRERIKSLADGLPDLEKFELEEKFKEMELKIQSFNASIGALEPFNNGAKDYLSADERAKNQWQEYVDKGKSLGADFVKGENRFDFSKLSDPEVIAQVQALNAALEKVGVNGKKLAIIFKKQALSNIADSAKAGEKALNDLSNVVRQTIQATKAFINVFSKAYDVMNDGENPKWMQDAQAFMDDFGEAFEMAIAPITAVLSLIIAITVATAILDTLLWPLLAIVAAAALFAGIMAAIQQHDRKLEHSIEDLKEDVEAFENASTNLQAAAERSVGFEKLRKNIEATGKDLEKATAYAEMARLEEEKKNTDESKVKEYKQSYQEAIDSFLNGMREVRDELVSSTEDWANAMGSAIRSAFQNGENAARAFRDTVKTMIGDVVEKMLQMAILEPLIESAIEEWTNSDYLRQKYTKEWTEKDENGKEIRRSKLEYDEFMNELLERIGDPELADEFYQSMLMIGHTLVDTVNGLYPLLKDAYMYNSELGTLSGGIESVTEDTARRIEALENSQLGEVFAIRTMLQNYLEGSGFGDSVTADLQAAVVSIAADTGFIRQYTEEILNEMRSLRNAPSRPLHVTMS